MEDGKKLIEALILVSQEKGIDEEVIFEAIEASLVSACKRQIASNADITCTIDRQSGKFKAFALKSVVESVHDENLEIELSEARGIDPACDIGSVLQIDVTPKNFGRISAQTAKQVVLQKIREAERENLYNEYKSRENTLITGIVQRRERRNVLISFGDLEAILTPAEQMPREYYKTHDRIKLYCVEVKQSTKGPQAFVSRIRPELLHRLLEHEVPEINDGIVEVVSIAREPGSRSKIAVYTKHPHVDPIGACVGQNGRRINLISDELRGEKLDVILYNEDPVKYIQNALSPCKVIKVVVSLSQRAARVVVADIHLSLAIGKDGQNARLAAKLTGWNIDIKGESQVRGTDYLVFDEPDFGDASDYTDASDFDAADGEVHIEHVDAQEESIDATDTHYATLEYEAEADAQRLPVASAAEQSAAIASEAEPADAAETTDAAEAAADEAHQYQEGEYSDEYDDEYYDDEYYYYDPDEYAEDYDEYSDEYGYYDEQQTPPDEKA